MKRSVRANVLIIILIALICLIIVKHQSISNFISTFKKGYSQNMFYVPFDKSKISGEQISTAQKIADTYKIALYVKTLQDKDYIKYTKDAPFNKTDKNNSPFYSRVIRDKNNKVTCIKILELER